jgi:hypothetical protein
MCRLDIGASDRHGCSGGKKRHGHECDESRADAEWQAEQPDCNRQQAYRFQIHLSKRLDQFDTERSPLGADILPNRKRDETNDMTVRLKRGDLHVCGMTTNVDD